MHWSLRERESESNSSEDIIAEERVTFRRTKRRNLELILQPFAKHVAIFQNHVVAEQLPGIDESMIG